VHYRPGSRVYCCGGARAPKGMQFKMAYPLPSRVDDDRVGLLFWQKGRRGKWGARGECYGGAALLIRAREMRDNGGWKPAASGCGLAVIVMTAWRVEVA